MTDHAIFKGAGTALITPITASGVDYDAFGRLIDWQIEKGIDALIIAATTGEGSTLDDKEHRQVLEYAAQRIAGRVPMIAGTGSNDTAYAVSLTKFACEVGADAALVVTPYYNKATQNGLIKMFNVIADASVKPLIVYNVPSRTGVNIEPATYAELAKNGNIAGAKEANGNISKLVETMSLVGDKMDIYSGNDDEVVPILSMGGSGVISVLSNLCPMETSRMCKMFWAGDVQGAAQMQMKYLPLIRSLFCEVNPIPVRAAMTAMGFCENYLRLPLTPMESAHEEKMLAIMKGLGII